MLRSSKISFQRERCLLTNPLHFSRIHRWAIFILATYAIWLAPASTNGQVSANDAAAPAQVGKICDGKMPPQKVALQVSGHQSGASAVDAATSALSEHPQSGADASKEGLKLSIKVASEQASEAEGQFCSRDRPSENGTRPSAVSERTGGSSQPTPAVAPSPIAQVISGGLTIRANGQDFASVLDSVRAVTGIAIEMPGEIESDPVFMNLGPVSTKEALMALLEGTKYNYVIVGSSQDAQAVTRLILSSRSSAGATPLVASSNVRPAIPQVEAYGGQGFREDAEAQNAEPPVPGPPPAPPAVIPSSVPTGINIQQLAAQSNKTPGQVLDELQKRQLQTLDDQAAAQAPPQ